MNLSIVISAYNEEKKIEDCLKSASFADEIIFVDNTSSDKTVEIAKKYTSKIFVRQNNLMLNVNKNIGFSKAKGDWILSLDSDERVSDELQKEIKTAISNKQLAISGFWIPRKNIIFGKWIKHTGWYPDYQLRLFKKEKGRFPEEHVHEMIEIEGETKRLTNPMIHYNYETVFQFLHKMTIYVPSEVNARIKDGYRIRIEDAINFPVKEFISRFFARKGYRDGLHGLVLSLLMAFYHLLVFVYIWEKQGFKEIGEDNILTSARKEFSRAGKEMNLWFVNEEIESTQNPIKRLLLKLWRKF